MERKLAIDAEYLILAMQSSFDMEASWYLDTESGAVLLDHDENGELIEAMTEDPRYIRIEQIFSYEAFDVMENFVEELGDKHVAQRLARALSGRKPFRAFKDALCDHPDVRAAWFEFEQQAGLHQAREWCEENGIEPEWKA